jgi:hypothetical protein
MFSHTSDQRQLCTRSVTAATTASVATHRCTLSTELRSSFFSPKPPGAAAEAAPHDAGHCSQLDAAAAVASVDGADQALRQDRQRVADAQQLRALLVVAATKLHARHALECVRRRREPQRRGRLQVMRARAAAVEDGAGGGGVQYGADNSV